MSADGEGNLLDEMLVHASCNPCAAQVVSSGSVGGQTEQPHRRDPQGIAGFSRLLTTDIRVYRGLVLSVLVVNERRGGSGRENAGAGVVPLPEKGMGFAGDLVHDKSRRLVLDGSRAVVVMSATCFPKEIGAFLTVVAHVKSL